MKLIGLVPLAGIIILLFAGISDGLAKEKTIYNKQCIDKGLSAEVESDKNCGVRNDSISCFTFHHSDCLIERSGNPPTGLAYLAGIIMVVCGGIGFGFMWIHDRDMKHKENMKALG